MCYYLELVDLEYKVVCVKSSDADIFTIVLGSYEKLNDLTLLITSSNWKLMNLTKVYVQLRAGKARALFSFHFFSGCDTVEKFTRKKKDT